MKQLVVGVDIGRVETLFGLIDLSGKIYAKGSIPTKKYPDFDQYVEELYIQIFSEIRILDDTAFEVVGIGVAAPDGNYYNGTIENAPNLAWKGVIPFVDKFKRFFPTIPVIITNDANAAAIGEMMFGGAKGMKDFIVVTLNTGLGSGFVANGHLVYGHDSLAGELGHVVVNHTSTGRMCGCGRRGCVETYASVSGLKRTVFKLLADHICDCAFRDIAFNELTADMITHAALENDCLAVEAYDYTSKMLGQALAHAVTITSPEAIFLVGELAKAEKYIFEPTKKYMDIYILRNFKNKVKIVPSQLNANDAAILGAAALIWQELSENSIP
ncbi:MAG: ROK family protein [Rikenellaceae bacterium]